MASSISFSYQKHRYIKQTIFDWLSDAAGAVSGILSDPVNGEIEKVVFVPDGGGTQPSDLYDVTLLDEDGFDVLAGQGANLSNVNKSQVCPGIPLKDGATTSVKKGIVNGTLQLVVTNAGNAKGGIVYLYTR